MKYLKVAFVGARRPPSDMPSWYWPTFVRFHLELPYYYARYSACHVHLVTTEPVEYNEAWAHLNGQAGGTLSCITEEEYCEGKGRYDVVVHWRRWFEDLYDHQARNVILSQDHSYSNDWQSAVHTARSEGKLDGILVFPTWHRENMRQELAHGQAIPLYEGLTLGVDTEVYSPGNKDPHHLLWASDPGRGLQELIHPFLKLYAKDRRYRLTVTYPDYVKPDAVARYDAFLRHPGVSHKPGLRNGPELWRLFNDAGVLPYSSTFPEPSSRCHRQAMAAGSMVLYPPNMGSPSELIENGLTGIVEPVELWADVIHSRVQDGSWTELGQNARTFALSENWIVQAERFHRFFSEGTK